MHPDIAALRSDPASQRRTSARMKAGQDAWLGKSGVEQVANDLTAYAGGADLLQTSVLQPLMTNRARASDFVGQFVEAFANTLRADPLGEIPMKHRSSAGYARLEVIRRGGAVLSLCVYEPVTKQRTPQTAQFVDCSSDEIVIAGRAYGYLQSLQSDQDGSRTVTSRKCQWHAGDRIIRQAQCETRQFVTVDQSLLVLQLTRTPAQPRPTREYRLNDGALVRQSSGDKRASEQLMALAVLGALGDAGALEEMTKFASDTAFDPDARWESVRQVLAMDSARGVPLLGRLAGNIRDPLASPAASLRDQLLASQPAFRQLAMEAQ